MIESTVNITSGGKGNGDPIMLVTILEVGNGFKLLRLAGQILVLVERVDKLHVSWKKESCREKKKEWKNDMNNNDEIFWHRDGCS